MATPTTISRTLTLPLLFLVFDGTHPFDERGVGGLTVLAPDHAVLTHTAIERDQALGEDVEHLDVEAPSFAVVID